MPEAHSTLYSLRPYRDSDAEILSDICLAAIRTIGPRGYSAKQIDAWAARHGNADRYRQRIVMGHNIFVAVTQDDVPVSYALLEPDGHLDRLYCHPAHSRRGLALQLLAEAELHARTHGIVRLYTEASELARASFEKAGYAVTHLREFAIDGVSIHNYAMEKTLT